MAVSTLDTSNGLKTIWDLPFFPSIAKLMPGSLSLMNGAQPSDESPFLASSKFFAQILPWAMFFSSCRATMLTKRVDDYLFYLWQFHNPDTGTHQFFCCSTVWEINYANPMCLIYFLWLTLHIRILPESSAWTQAAWQLPVSSLLTPIFLSSSRGQGPHAQQTPEPWCLQVIETTRLALRGKHWVVCICTYGTIVAAVWRRPTSYSINAHAIDQQEVFVRYLTHQAGSLKEWLQDVKKREMSTLLDLTGVVVCSWPKKCSIIFCMLFCIRRTSHRFLWIESSSFRKTFVSCFSPSRTSDL